MTTTPVPKGDVTQVAVYPSTATTAYVTFSGFGSCNNSAVVCDGKGHVFKTINGTAGAGTPWGGKNGTPKKHPPTPLQPPLISPHDSTHHTPLVGSQTTAFFSPPPARPDS